MFLAHAQSAAPSPWVTRFAGLVQPGGSVLDVACGSGRHVLWLAQHGWRVTGVDRDAAAVASLSASAEIVVADIETAAWPLPGRQFDGIVVTNYLWRALLPTLVAALAERGVLIYETFAQGQQGIGKPSRPEFLLQPGELLTALAGLRVVAFEDGFEERQPRFVQRIVAVKEGRTAAQAPRYRLDGPAS